MNDQLIELESIADNPWQPRVVDDPTHIEGLGRSIAADGLLQLPKARRNGHGFQLAFGHSRRKAFEWLRDNWEAQGLTNRYNAYTWMPIEEVALTDEEMYRYAVTENVQRKDLNPIELAKTMSTYRDQFGKNSDQIGELFGFNGATVRGMTRLLDLPEPVQEKVASGEISQGAARKLLTIARASVDQSSLTDIAKDIASGENPDEVIENSLRANGEKVVEMWPSWKRDEKPCAGKALWLLTMTPDKFPMNHLPKLTAADAAKALGIEFTAQNRPDLETWIEYLGTGWAKDSDGVHWKPDVPIVDHLIAQGAPEDQIEKIAQLITPPTCMTCPFHAVVDRSHYCTFKPCHQRKVKAWVARDLEKVSKKLSIPVYDPAADGKVFIALCEHSYMDKHKVHAKLVKDKDSNLRVAYHKDEYNDHEWTKSHFARLVLVGEGAEVEKQKMQAAKAHDDGNDEKLRRQRELESARCNASRNFTYEYAAGVLAVVFKELNNIPVMCALARQNMPRKGAKKAEVLADLRKELVIDVLHNLDGWDWRVQEKGPTAAAKYIEKVAQTWGVKLPADFLEVAKKYEPAVAAETAKKNGKKA